MDIRNEHSKYDDDEEFSSGPVAEPLPGKEEDYIDDLVAQFNKHEDIHADIGDAVSLD